VGVVFSQIRQRVGILTNVVGVIEVKTISECCCHLMAIFV